MFCAPFFHVNFADFWLADQLNSLVVAMLDFQFLVCFYWTNNGWLEAGGSFFLLNSDIFLIVSNSVSDTAQCSNHNFVYRPIVNCIPAWIRFAQCLRRYHDTKEAFPHLVNAGKYASTFFVVIFGTLRNYYKGIIIKTNAKMYIATVFLIRRFLCGPNSKSVLVFVDRSFHNKFLLRVHVGY